MMNDDFWSRSVVNGDYAVSTKHVNERRVLSEKLQESNRNLLSQAFSGTETQIVNESSPTLNPFVFAVENILKHSLKSRQQEERTTFWNFLDNLDKISSHGGCKTMMKDLRELQLVKTPEGRGRAWIRYCLNENVLNQYLTILINNRELTKSYYEDHAYVCTPSDSSFFLSLLVGVDGVPFKTVVDNPVLDNIEPIDAWNTTTKKKTKITRKKKKKNVASIEDAEDMEATQTTVQSVINQEVERRVEEELKKREAEIRKAAAEEVRRAKWQEQEEKIKAALKTENRKVTKADTPELKSALPVPVLPTSASPVSGSPAIPLPVTPSAVAGVPEAPAIPVPAAPAIPIPEAPAIPVPEAPAIPVPEAPAIPIPTDAPISTSPVPVLMDSVPVPRAGVPEGPISTPVLAVQVPYPVDPVVPTIQSPPAIPTSPADRVDPVDLTDPTPPADLRVPVAPIPATDVDSNSAVLEILETPVQTLVAAQTLPKLQGVQETHVPLEPLEQELDQGETPLEYSLKVALESNNCPQEISIPERDRIEDAKALHDILPLEDSPEFQLSDPTMDSHDSHETPSGRIEVNNDEKVLGQTNGIDLSIRDDTSSYALLNKAENDLPSDIDKTEVCKQENIPGKESQTRRTLHPISLVSSTKVLSAFDTQNEMQSVTDGSHLGTLEWKPVSENVGQFVQSPKMWDDVPNVEKLPDPTVRIANAELHTSNSETNHDFHESTLEWPEWQSMDSEKKKPSHDHETEQKLPISPVVSKFEELSGLDLPKVPTDAQTGYPPARTYAISEFGANNKYYRKYLKQNSVETSVDPFPDGADRKVAMKSRSTSDVGSPLRKKSVSFKLEANTIKTFQKNSSVEEIKGTVSFEKPMRKELLFVVHNKQTPADQNYGCHGCSSKLSTGLFAAVRYCEYTGKYYCKNCHSNSKFVIPGRILQQWDFKNYPVCDSSKEYLESIYFFPLFNVSAINRQLYTLAPYLKIARALQQRLVYMTDFVSTCKNGCHLVKLAKEREHLIKDAGFFSLNDLMEVHKGTMLDFLRELSEKFISHIQQCPLCLGQGSYCEYCKGDKPIYPFDVTNVVLCKRCSGVFHRKCYNKSSCPKCARRNRQSKQTPTEL